MIGFVLISFKPGYGKSICDSLSKDDMVLEVNPLFGEYDLMVKVKGETNDDIGQFIVNRIRATEGVAHTKTLMSSLMM